MFRAISIIFVISIIIAFIWLYFFLQKSTSLDNLQQAQVRAAAHIQENHTGMDPSRSFAPHAIPEGGFGL